MKDFLHIFVLKQIMYYSQFMFGIVIVAVFNARLTSTLAFKEAVPIFSTLYDVHDMGYNLYIQGTLFQKHQV